jgi:hypothetical protein
MVTIVTKRFVTSKSAGCPTAAGLVEGASTVRSETTTTTTIGDRRVTERESQTIETTFTGHVGDDANLAAVDIERHEHGEATTRTEVGEVATTERATYDVDVTLPGGGQPSATGSRTLHAGKRSQEVSDDLDRDIVDAAGKGSQSEVGALLVKAQKLWQTPNRCAQAVYHGDGQAVRRGGVASAFADMITTRTPDSGGSGGGATLPARFTVTGACGAVPNPSTDTSGQDKSAHFYVNDTSHVWGTRGQPKGCLQLRGVSRGGVTSGTLTFPVTTTYVVSYTGSSTYDYSSTFSFMGVTSSESQSDTFGWSTTYDPITLAPDQTVAADTNGTDVLSGSAQTHDADDSGSRTCDSAGIPSDREGNRPRLTITNPTSTGFDMELRESGVAAWDANCDDGETRSIYPADDTDPSPDLDFIRQAHVDYAQLDAGPVTIQVGSTPEQAAHDCSAEHISCTSALKWTGTITISNGQ